METSTNPADITPQFALLFPVLQAIGFNAFSFTGLFSVNAVLGSLSIFCFYLFIKEKAEKIPAFPAAVEFQGHTHGIFFQLAFFRGVPHF